MPYLTTFKSLLGYELHLPSPSNAWKLSHSSHQFPLSRLLLVNHRQLHVCSSSSDGRTAAFGLQKSSLKRFSSHEGPSARKGCRSLVLHEQCRLVNPVHIKSPLQDARTTWARPSPPLNRRQTPLQPKYATTNFSAWSVMRATMSKMQILCQHGPAHNSHG